MWPGASAALPAPRETGLHCWTPRGLLAPEPRTLPDVLGDPGQVSRSPSARRTERHPGQRMELGPRPPHGTQAACPSARAPAPNPEAAPSQRMSLPPPAPSAALPWPRGSPPMPSGSCDCGAGTRRGARGVGSAVGVRKSGAPWGCGAGRAGGEGVRSAAAPGQRRDPGFSPTCTHRATQAWDAASYLASLSCWRRETKTEEKLKPALAERGAH